MGDNWNLQVMFAHVFVILLDCLISHLYITHWSAHLKVLLRFLGFGCSPKMLNDAAFDKDKLKRDHIQQSSDRESLRYKSTSICPIIWNSRLLPYLHWRTPQISWGILPLILKDKKYRYVFWFLIWVDRVQGWFTTAPISHLSYYYFESWR